MARQVEFTFRPKAALPEITLKWSVPDSFTDPRAKEMGLTEDDALRKALATMRISEQNRMRNVAIRIAASEPALKGERLTARLQEVLNEGPARGSRSVARTIVDLTVFSAGSIPFEALDIARLAAHGKGGEVKLPEWFTQEQAKRAAAKESKK